MEGDLVSRKFKGPLMRQLLQAMVAMAVCVFVVRAVAFQFASMRFERAKDKARLCGLWDEGASAKDSSNRGAQREALRIYAAAIAVLPGCISELDVLRDISRDAGLPLARPSFVRNDPRPSVLLHREKLEEGVRKAQLSLDLLARAATIDYEFDVSNEPWSEPYRIRNCIGVWTNFQSARRVAKAAQAAALLLAQNEDERKGPTRALENCRALVRYSDLLATDRTLIAEMIRARIYQDAIGIAAHILRRNEPDVDVCESLRTTLLARDPISLLKHSLTGEVRHSCRAIDALVEQVSEAEVFWGSLGWGKLPSIVRWGLLPGVLWDAAFAVERICEIHSAVSHARGPREILLATSIMNQRVAWYHPYDLVSGVNWQGAIERFIECRAQRDLLLIRLGERLQRARLDLAPFLLDEISLDLIPASCRIDPFSGSEYGVVFDGETTGLYSVGRNGVDDNGLEDDLW